MSAEVLRRLRAHRDLDAFMVRAIAFLGTQNEPVLRSEDLLQQLAANIGKTPELQKSIDLVFQLFIGDGSRNFAAFSWLLLDARIVRAQNQARAVGLELVFEPSFFEALKRGEKPHGGVVLYERPEREQLQQQLKAERGDEP